MVLDPEKFRWASITETDPNTTWRTNGVFGGIWNGSAVPAGTLSVKLRNAVIKTKW